MAAAAARSGRAKPSIKPVEAKVDAAVVVFKNPRREVERAGAVCTELRVVIL
jgi:hypothetical protein